MKIPANLTLIGFSLMACSSVAFSSIVKDSFDDGNRSIQSPPQSLAYFANQGPNSLIEQEGALIFNGFKANRFFMAYLTEPGKYIDLAVGEAISLKFTFRPDIVDLTQSRHLRFALFESGDTIDDSRAVSSDSYGTDLLGLQNYRGYQASLSLRNSPANEQMVLAKRHKTFNDLLIIFNPANSGYSHLGLNGQGDFVSKQVYTAQLNIIRLEANKAEITAIVVPDGPDSTAETDCFVKVIDTHSPTLRFDSLAIGLNTADGAVRDIQIEELEVFKLRISD
ncbi:MAG: hypothetical protein ABS34_07025 [Opitutaceae bacterium BACL24 MAG-120322-bin51]|nr:MAG: hypothetical protein ABS34_07025 [Opitutaceae bacterium BACL24 MAG-120322-bin51]